MSAPPAGVEDGDGYGDGDGYVAGSGVVDSRRSSIATARSSVSRSRHGLYRRGSNLSEASFFTDVEMATEEVFSGPMSESVPTSVSAFSHRRRERAGSTASQVSFTYYSDDRESSDGEGGQEGEAYLNGHRENGDYDEDMFVEDDDLDINGERRESRRRSSSASFTRRASTPKRRKSSSVSRRSASPGAPLLRHHSNASSDAGYHGGGGGRVSQKIYIMTEDLTIVIAGFKTSAVGFSIYVALCLVTAGLAWLLFRWLPIWRVRLLGSPTPLGECDWVVVENQWGEFETKDVKRQPYGRGLSTIFGPPEKSCWHGEFDVDEDPLVNEFVSLDYRYIRFCYHPLRDRFVAGNNWRDPLWTDVASLRTGLDNEEKESRERVFGKNAIDIEEKSTGQLLVDEVFHPFYMFQVASLILWSIDEYYYYAICIFAISIVSIVATLIETKANMRRLREVSHFECDIRVLRNGFWRYVESSELVPGDVYEVTDPDLTQFPCDSLLLSGDCIVNESMLTGESVPVSKVPTTNEALNLLDLSASSIHPDVAKHLLFCGTKIIRARRPQDDKDDEAAGLAMVIRTGFNTTKGALVRSMLFPKPSGFKFYRDSFRYIGVMFGVAMLGFIVSFVNFIRLGLAWHLIIVRALDLITIVVPPALPATLTIGTSFALSRLRKKQIFCISPQRVNVGGKLDVVCFDKTGTLTEDGLDVLGLRVVQRPGNHFSELLADPLDVLPGCGYDRDPTIDYAANKTLLYTMATCHSLRNVEGELVGDPLDVKMFQFTGWSYEEGEQSGGGEEEEQLKLSPSVARPPPGMEYDIDDDPNNPNNKPIELGILKSFEFVSALRRASVVVRQFASPSGSIYVKGAPECMRDICKPESFPPDYDDLLAYYTHRGYRVIACATKLIRKLNWVKVQKMKREEAESDLEFVGFIIFENKLKPATAGIIDELNAANIRTVMCTGDNVLTAISVGRECRLIDRAAHCFVPHFTEGDPRTPLAKLSWESVDNPIFQLDENTLKPLPPPDDSQDSVPYDLTNISNYTLAITGDVFRWIIDYASEKVLREMLVRGQIFARMSPDEKHELVEKLQSIDYCAGFCGDGANDCGALKAADVGISLSEAEASVAAPFTSRVFDISCVPEVIREGRAALVTSFSCFKYMSLYSAIQFTSVSFLYVSGTNIGDLQFLFIDLLLILPIAIFMGWSGPYPILSRKRPTASLVSRKVLVPLLGQIVLCILVQMIVYIVVQKQDWYIPPVLDRNHSNALNSQTTSLFMISCYQYIFSAVVLNVGPPFRQSMARNLPFVITILVTLLFSTYLLLDPAGWIMQVMDITPMELDFKIELLVLAGIAFGVSYASEKMAFPRLARAIGKLKEKRPRWRKKRKEYKLILEGKEEKLDV